MNKDMIAAGILAFSAFLFFVLVMPQYDRISLTRAALEEREFIYADRAVAIEKVKSLDRQLQERSGDIDKILIFLPEGKQIDQLLSSIDQVSQQSGIQLTTLVSSDAVAGAENYSKLLVSLDLNGIYTNFINFLTNLESNLRLYDIAEINVSEATNGASAGTLNMTVRLNAYFLN